MGVVQQGLLYTAAIDLRIRESMIVQAVWSQCASGGGVCPKFTVSVHNVLAITQ